MVGDFGELLVAKSLSCPKCKSDTKTLKLLPQSFVCADLICKFCGYLAQVKTARVNSLEKIPNKVLGAAWKPQSDRIAFGIYTPIFLVLITPGNECSIYYLPSDFQTKEMFVPREPLSSRAKTPGWQGYTIVFDLAIHKPLKLL